MADVQILCCVSISPGITVFLKGLVNLKIIGWALEKLYLLSWLIVECSCFEIHQKQMEGLHTTVQVGVKGCSPKAVDFFTCFELYILKADSLIYLTDRVLL